MTTLPIDPAYITWNAPVEDPHPARLAALRSAMTVCTGTKDQWVALFAPGGVVEDPVGPSMFDPEGRGHHGAEGIGAFWDAAIGMVDRFHFTINDSHANGNVCANVGTISTWIGETRIDTDLVMVYTVTAEEQIASMRAYWNPDRAMATARSTADQEG